MKVMVEFSCHFSFFLCEMSLLFDKKNLFTQWQLFHPLSNKSFKVTCNLSLRPRKWGMKDAKEKVSSVELKLTGLTSTFLFLKRFYSARETIINSTVAWSAEVNFSRESSKILTIFILVARTFVNGKWRSDVNYSPHSSL